MPDDANGNYFLPPTYRVQTGDYVLPSQHNPSFEDVAQALTNRMNRDGRTPWQGDMRANGYTVTGLRDGTAPTDAATIKQLEEAGFDGVTQEQLREKTGTGTMAYRDVTWGTASPSGGENGDIYLQFI